MMKLNSSFVLDVPLTALNNSGLDEDVADNEVRVKSFYQNGTNPYISGQAWRKWWRDTLESRCGWELSPFHLGENTREAGGNKGQYGHTEADPVRYPDDDLFGYMRVDKKSVSDNCAAKRISPFKTSNVVAIHTAFTRDLITQSKLAEIASGTSIAFRELYQAVMVGQFTLELDRVGRFQFREKPDDKSLAELSTEVLRTHLGNTDLRWIKHDVLELPVAVRRQRVKDLLTAFSVIEGGANLTRGLADIIPRVAIFTFTETGNALLQGVFRYENDKLHLNMDRLREILKDRHTERFYLYVQAGYSLEYSPMDELEVYDSWSSILDVLHKLVDQHIEPFAVEYGGIDRLLETLASQPSKSSKSGEGKDKRGKSRDESAQLDLGEEL